MKILFSFIIPLALFFATFYAFQKLAGHRERIKRPPAETIANIKKIYFITLLAAAAICFIIFLIIALIIDGAVSGSTGFSKFLIFITMLVKSCIFSEFITNILYNRINLDKYLGGRKISLANAGRINKNLLLKFCIVDCVINIICALAVVI